MYLIMFYCLYKFTAILRTVVRLKNAYIHVQINTHVDTHGDITNYN